MGGLPILTDRRACFSVRRTAGCRRREIDVRDRGRRPWRGVRNHDSRSFGRTRFHSHRDVAVRRRSRHRDDDGGLPHLRTPPALHLLRLDVARRDLVRERGDPGAEAGMPRLRRPRRRDSVPFPHRAVVRRRPVSPAAASPGAGRRFDGRAPRRVVRWFGRSGRRRRRERPAPKLTEPATSCPRPSGYEKSRLNWRLTDVDGNNLEASSGFEPEYTDLQSAA